MKKLMLSIVLLMSGASLFSAGGNQSVDPAKVSNALEEMLNPKNKVKSALKSALKQSGFDHAKISKILQLLESAKVFADKGNALAAAGLVDDIIKIVGGESQAGALRLTINGKDYSFGWMLLVAATGGNMALFLAQ